MPKKALLAVALTTILAVIDARPTIIGSITSTLLHGAAAGVGTGVGAVGAARFFDSRKGDESDRPPATIVSPANLTDGQVAVYNSLCGKLGNGVNCAYNGETKNLVIAVSQHYNAT